MAKVENKSKQNPKLQQTILKDGRASLYLEYYLGRSETPVLDEEGNQVYYTTGAMAGKPKYKIKHARKKENLNLYIWIHPRNQQERIQNRNTLALAEKTRFEREQQFLEDREGYKFKKDTNFNFFDYFQQKIDISERAYSYKSGMKLALRRFQAFLAETPRYSVYANYIRPDQLNPEMMSDYADYLMARGKGAGPQTIFMRFKRIINMALEEEILRKDPCKGVSIKADKLTLNKDILSPDEIEKLLNTHYPHENPVMQRAFILTLYTGIRFNDIKLLAYRNIDYVNKTMRFEQHKTRGLSNSNIVISPLSDAILAIIGYPSANTDLDSLIFDLPSYHTCLASLKKWVKRAGINKKISWHCGRHSFAVNLLRGGTNIKTVQTLLGHAKIEMTSRYLHVIDSDKVEAIDGLGPIEYTEKYSTNGYSAEDRKRMSENCKGGVRFRGKRNVGEDSDSEEIAV